MLILAFAADPVRAGGLMLGNCTLEKDPSTPEGQDELGSAVCLKGLVGTEATTYAEAPREAEWINYGNAYAGLYAKPWLSAHIRGIWRHIRALKDHIQEDQDIYTDLAVVEIGNPVVNHYRLTLGHSRLPFGLDATEAAPYYQALENRLLWASPWNTAYATYDDLRSFRLDAGVATSDVIGPESRTKAAAKAGREIEPLDRAASVRAMLDVSALEGTRMILSGYGAQLGERRYGLALVNINHKTDTVELEFVRRLTTPDGKQDPFQQIIRAAYTTAWQREQRWALQYDDERQRFRRGMVRWDKILTQHLIINLDIGFYQGVGISNLARWGFTSGLEAPL